MNVKCLLSPATFYSAVDEWQSTVEDTFLFFFAPNIPEDKEAVARRYCAVPEKETIFFLYDKTVFGKADCCTLFTSKGIYSNEDVKKFYFDGKRNNFVSWEKFFQGFLLTKEQFQIYLDGERIINGFVDAKMFFSLLAIIKKHLHNSFPFSLVLPKTRQIPPEEVLLDEKEVLQVLPKVGKLIKKKLKLNKGKKMILHKKPQTHEELPSICQTSPKDNFWLEFRRGRDSTLICNTGIWEYTKQKKSHQPAPTKFLSWNEFLNAELLWLKNKRTVVGETANISHHRSLFWILCFLHADLSAKFKPASLPAPPTYDEVGDLWTKVCETTSEALFTSPTQTTGLSTSSCCDVNRNSFLVDWGERWSFDPLKNSFLNSLEEPPHYPY
eukprot:TRINITY_DN9264_c0_g1_i1.p1 TRINITY_DN9264_c0_g1~~TRINITY_DN9264_c0_g1_i1.p1  ORF type:complete len:383 (-),score=91.83 TRINITY_DN9264_c0_g1_i1:274-1422(-)